LAGTHHPTFARVERAPESAWHGVYVRVPVIKVPSQTSGIVSMDSSVNNARDSTSTPQGYHPLVPHSTPLQPRPLQQHSLQGNLQSTFAQNHYVTAQSYDDFFASHNMMSDPNARQTWSTPSSLNQSLMQSSALPHWSQQTTQSGSRTSLTPTPSHFPQSQQYLQNQPSSSNTQFSHLHQHHSLDSRSSTPLSHQSPPTNHIHQSQFLSHQHLQPKSSLYQQYSVTPSVMHQGGQPQQHIYNQASTYQSPQQQNLTHSLDNYPQLVPYQTELGADTSHALGSHSVMSSQPVYGQGQQWQNLMPASASNSNPLPNQYLMAHNQQHLASTASAPFVSSSYAAVPNTSRQFEFVKSMPLPTSVTINSKPNGDAPVARQDPRSSIFESPTPANQPLDKGNQGH